MPKAGELNYLKNIGAGGRQHIAEKPFSDEYCGLNLASIGTILSLLPPPPAVILDMGCGGGWTSIVYAKRGYTVVGQDISDDMIELARANQAKEKVDNRLTFVISDFESLNHEARYDVVIFYDCLHHAEDERAAMASAHLALKSGGLLLTHEPGEGHAEAPGTIEAMRRYSVTEKDMPPHKIVATGLDVGFSTYRIYPMQHDLIEMFYKQTIPPILSRAAFERARRILRAAFSPSKRASSIVVMKK